MKIIHPLLIAVCALLLSESAFAGPPRPALVPKEAVWAGGADGGAWIDCARMSKEPWGPVFQCTIFDDAGGLVWARGLYVVGKKINGKFQREKRVDGPPRYSYVDGVILGLVGDKAIMVPHGLIDYPFPDGGKRITYDHGSQVGPEKQY
jgi:hypothetical protein